MDDKLYFEFCNDHRGDIINIYIHGYSAIRCTADKEFLKQCIPERKKNSTNIFAFWPSGKILGGFLEYTKLIQFITRGAIFELASLGYGEIEKFKSVEKDIRRLTYEFVIELLKFIKKERLEYSSINLYGHSLGARLIIESIINIPDHFESLKVNNIIFMGGARNLNINECELILSAISGKVFNIYSSSDYILKYIKPDREKCIGIYPIQAPPELSSRIENHAFNLLGHMDYWENIKGIISYLNLDKQSNNYLLPVHNSTINSSFPSNDVPLFIPLCYATDSEKEVLTNLICSKISSSISLNERDPVVITNEIQLMGGDSILNKTRGHGVIYSEIVHDAADYLNVSEYQKIEFKYLEGLILEEVLSILKNELTSSDENKKILITKIIQIIYSYSDGGNYNKSHINAFLQLIELIKNKNIKSLYISGPAYSVTIPIIVMVHHIRNRIINEVGVSFFP